MADGRMGIALGRVTIALLLGTSAAGLAKEPPCGVGRSGSRAGHDAPCSAEPGAAAFAPLSVHSEGCVVAEVPTASVTAALSALTAPGPARGPEPPSRWTALLPQGVGLSLRGSQREGSGRYSAIDGATSERDLWGADFGYGVRVTWDLRPLWAPTAAADIDPAHRLRQAAAGEELAARVAVQLEHLRKAQAAARGSPANSMECAASQAQAEAAALVLQAVISAAQR